MLYVCSFDHLSAQKSVGPIQSAKINENNMLDHRFSVAPMMDWTDRPRKAKHSQCLSVFVLTHAGLNAVPAFDERYVANKIRFPAALGGCRVRDCISGPHTLAATSS